MLHVTLVLSVQNCDARCDVHLGGGGCFRHVPFLANHSRSPSFPQYMKIVSLCLPLPVLLVDQVPRWNVLSPETEMIYDLREMLHRVRHLALIIMRIELRSSVGSVSSMWKPGSPRQLGNCAPEAIGRHEKEETHRARPTGCVSSWRWKSEQWKWRALFSEWKCIGRWNSNHELLSEGLMIVGGLHVQVQIVRNGCFGEAGGQGTLTERFRHSHCWHFGMRGSQSFYCEESFSGDGV